jgi:hypothetical protein
VGRLAPIFAGLLTSREGLAKERHRSRDLPLSALASDIQGFL